MNIFDKPDDNLSPTERAKQALNSMRQYQKDWEELGVDRVHKYFTDVEGDWLENWKPICEEEE